MRIIYRHRPDMKMTHGEVLKRHRGHRIMRTNDGGIVIEYRYKRKVWRTADDITDAIRIIDEAKAELKRKIS